MSEWYISRGNGREGPMTAKIIAALLARGEFRANETLAWKNGMGDWKTIAESGVLTEAALGKDAPVMERPPKPTTIKNPLSAPVKGSQSSLPKRRAFKKSGDDPGVGRCFYIISVMLALAWILGILFAVTDGDEWDIIMFRNEHRELFLLVHYTIGMGVLMVTYKRLKNLGMSGWWLIGLIVPVLNMWVFWRTTSCPAGYVDHQSLDTGGKIASGVFVLVILLPLLTGLIPGLA